MLVTPKRLQTLVYASLRSPGREERYSLSQCGLERSFLEGTCLLRSFLAVTCLCNQEKIHRLVVSNPERARAITKEREMKGIAHSLITESNRILIELTKRGEA
jgi:hypothetical protein